MKRVSNEDYFVENTFHEISVLEVGKSVAITISVQFPVIDKLEIERAKCIIEAEGKCHFVPKLNTIRNIGRILSEDASLSVFVLDLNGKVSLFTIFKWNRLDINNQKHPQIRKSFYYKSELFA